MPSSACQTCARSEEHTSELQSHDNLVCRLLLEKKRVRRPRERCRAGGGRVRRPRAGSARGEGLAPRAVEDVVADHEPAERAGTSFFFLIIRRPPGSPLFPYPTLFQSRRASRGWRCGSRSTRRYRRARAARRIIRSGEHTSELPAHRKTVCRLLLDK